MYVFGSCDIFGVPLQDASGNAIVNPTPIRLGAVQEVGLDFSGDIKELYGQLQFAVVIARGKVKVTGKAKGAVINGQALNTLFLGQGIVAGTQGAVYTDNTGTVVPGTPYQITVTPPNAGTFVQDMGVVNASGIPMTAVASAPTTGQYAVSGAGVYTFAAADTGINMFISYQYTATVALAKKLHVQNLAMGAAPIFGAYFVGAFQGKRFLVKIYNAVSQKLTLLSTKIDDYNIPEFDFSAQADSSGNVADIYTQE
jgi:hypothetical protein